MFLYSPDFLIFSVIVMFMILYLVFKVIDVINNTKKRKSLERIVNFFVSEGDTVMKNLFAKAIAQVDAEHSAQPISGNEQELSAVIAKVYKRSEQQGFGLAQLMSFSSFLKAANNQQGEINEIIIAVRKEMESENCRFDSETKQLLQNALAKGPDELIKVLQQAVQAEAPAPAEAQPETSVVESTEISAPVSTVADNVVSIDSVASEENSATAVVDNEEELKQLLAGCDWLPVKLPEEPYKIMDLPASTFDRLWGAFNVRLHKTSDEQRASQLLDGIKTIRDGEPAQKVGWNNPTIRKSCWNMQLFFIFKNIYDIIILNIIFNN